MEVVSTSNLVSSENEKTTACNFQKSQIGTYAYMQTSSYS